jgi:hypothetical protein
VDCRWLLGEGSDPARRTVIPSDGSAAVMEVLEQGAKPTAGPWKAVYGPKTSSAVEARVDVHDHEH